MGFDMLRWKDPGSWTTRDFERLGDVMDEYMARRRGRQGSGDGGGNGHGGGGGGGYGGGRNGLEGLLGGGGNNNQGRGMDDLLRLRLLNMEQLSRDLGYRVYGLEDLLLGTEHERRTGQFQQHMGRVFGPGRGYDGGGDGGGLYGQPFGLQRDRLRDAVGRGRYGPWDGYY